MREIDVLRFAVSRVVGQNKVSPGATHCCFPTNRGDRKPSKAAPEEPTKPELVLLLNVFIIVLHIILVFYVLYCCYTVFMYGHTYYSNSTDQPCKVANPARGQLNREN